MTTTTTNSLYITVLRSTLLEALAVVSGAVGSDASSLPILRSFLLRASLGVVYCATTDLEVAIEYSFPGKVSEEGALALPFQVFSGIIKNLRSERVSLRVEGLTLHITADNYVGAVYGQSAEDFPIIPSLETPRVQGSFSEALLSHALSRVVFATQHSDIRPEISGVRIHPDAGDLVFAATDSFRLARFALSSENHSFSGDEAFTLPIRTAQDLVKILTSSEEDVKIFSDLNQILFQAGSWKMTSRLVQGAFPDYTQIIPREFRGEAELKREEFLHGVKIVSALSGRGNDIALEVGGNKKFLELKASEGTLGEGAYKIPAKISGDVFSIIFNWKYLLQGLQACDGESVVLQAGKAERPVILRNPQNQRFLYVVMPIRG